MTREGVRKCFESAQRDEGKARKHKGLLAGKRDDKKAEEYVQKAKTNLDICDLYKDRKLDYKIPEEWFYTLYYCALAILAKFGVESRSQRCTALFLRYVKDKRFIDYDDEFIDQIMVYKQKDELSIVDEREAARYGSGVQSEEIIAKYEMMMDLCKRAISACEDIVFSDRQFQIPEEFLGD